MKRQSATTVPLSPNSLPPRGERDAVSLREFHVKFSDQAWEDYLFWQAGDRAVLKRINLLLRDIQRAPFEGIGKPEPLKHHLSGFWSRRIDDEHRLVYAVRDDSILVAQCRYHY